MTELMFDTIENGGVASACGFSAGGIHAGFRDDPNRLDMALVEADELVQRRVCLLKMCFALLL